MNQPISESTLTFRNAACTDPFWTVPLGGLIDEEQASRVTRVSASRLSDTGRPKFVPAATKHQPYGPIVIRGGVRICVGITMASASSISRSLLSHGAKLLFQQVPSGCQRPDTRLSDAHVDFPATSTPTTKKFQSNRRMQVRICPACGLYNRLYGIFRSEAVSLYCSMLPYFRLHESETSSWICTISSELTDPDNTIRTTHLILPRSL